MRFVFSRRVGAAAALAAAILLIAHHAGAQNLTPVDPPDFTTPQIGYYASWTYPTAGWELISGGPGDPNSNPSAGATNSSGPTVKRAGMYSAQGPNVAEVWCNPNYYWIYYGTGTSPIGATYHEAATVKTDGDCIFNVTIGTALRKPVPNPATPLPAPALSELPAPSAGVPYTFNYAAFASNVVAQVQAGSPAPVGFELAVTDPNGNVVYNQAFGSVTGNLGYLPPTKMTPNRRFDVNSMSKTITATAVLAAFEQLTAHKPALNVTLDSSILPYMPLTWAANAGPGVAGVSFRSLLRHTSGFCKDGDDTYAGVQQMVETGVCSQNVGKWHYYDYNFTLLRVVLAYLVDGPATFRPYENQPTLNAELTALAYRNFARNKIFDPIGLSTVDEYYVGPLPETVFFSGDVAEPDGLNVPGAPCSGVDRHADYMVLTAGSGRWNLSAEEYSVFISSLWRGKILSSASLNEMLAANDPDNTGIGLGMYGSQPPLSPAPAGGNPYWDFNHNGGGCGENGDWMTFFNGYTAVILSNSDWAIGEGEYSFLEKEFVAQLQHK